MSAGRATHGGAVRAQGAAEAAQKALPAGSPLALPPAPPAEVNGAQLIEGFTKVNEGVRPTLRPRADIDGNEFNMTYLNDADESVRLTVTDVDGNQQVLGEFLDKESATAWVNAASRGVEHPDDINWIVDENELDRLIGEFAQATGWFSETDVPQLRAIAHSLLEAEERVFGEQGAAEEAAGLSHKMVQDYSPGYIPVGKMDKDTKSIMQAAGIDPTEVEAEYARRFGGDMAQGRTVKPDYRSSYARSSVSSSRPSPTT
jgi:hypothetical protein